MGGSWRYHLSISIFADRKANILPYLKKAVEEIESGKEQGMDGDTGRMIFAYDYELRKGIR